MCCNRTLCIAIEILLIDGERVGHLMEEPYELRARASTGPAPAGE